MFDCIHDPLKGKYVYNLKANMCTTNMCTIFSIKIDTYDNLPKGEGDLISVRCISISRRHNVEILKQTMTPRMHE